MYKIKNFIPRDYQETIFEGSKDKNTLICLPTGTGKTKNAILLAVYMLNKKPTSKVVILSPTKPLADQICKEFKECTTIEEDIITLLTGLIKPEERTKLFNNSKIIVATPQTIENDTRKKRVTLKDVSLLIVDECHRSKEKFANTTVARCFNQQQPEGRILALTASPGATKEKVNEVCHNLFIENVEIRTDEDTDLAPHLQTKNVEYNKVELTPKLQTIQTEIREMFKSVAGTLSSYGVYKPTKFINKKDLLLLQHRFQKEIKNGNPLAYTAISKIAKLIKILYLLELVETQTTTAALKYLKKLETETSKAAKSIMKDKRITHAKKILEKLQEEKIDHPKIQKLKQLVEKELEEKENARIIIFANYRATVEEINAQMKTIKKAKPTNLMGQSKGFSQKDQLNILKNFNQGESNILITTSIGEEGISIGSLDIAIFYDQTASEIRKIQRTGRVARIKPGKIVHIIAKGTRDEALLWTAAKKEKTMHNILHSMKRKLTSEKQTKLKG